MEHLKDLIMKLGIPDFRDKVSQHDDTILKELAKLNLQLTSEIWDSKSLKKYNKIANQVLFLMTYVRKKELKDQSLNWEWDKIKPFVLYDLPVAKLMVEKFHCTEHIVKFDLYNNFKKFFYIEKGSEYTSIMFFAFICFRFELFFSKEYIKKNEKSVNEIVKRDKEGNYIEVKEKQTTGVLKELSDNIGIRQRRSKAKS